MFYHENYNPERDEIEPVNDVLTPREVMGYLYIGRNTFYRLVNSGQLKAFRIGKLWRVRREEVQQYPR